ncbi:hypothetical protein BC833DRAFT_581020 [Globomyces pollinis-pini]|nr:hypothetical protein BC833DRAFT_581020 [Globomyces pollinis-pini]
MDNNHFNTVTNLYIQYIHMPSVSIFITSYLEELANLRTNGYWNTFDFQSNVKTIRQKYALEINQRKEIWIKYPLYLNGTEMKDILGLFEHINGQSINGLTISRSNKSGKDNLLDILTKNLTFIINLHIEELNAGDTVKILNELKLYKIEKFTILNQSIDENDFLGLIRFIKLGRVTDLCIGALDYPNKYVTCIIQMINQYLSKQLLKLEFIGLTYTEEIYEHLKGFLLKNQTLTSLILIETRIISQSHLCDILRLLYDNQVLESLTIGTYLEFSQYSNISQCLYQLLYQNRSLNQLSITGLHFNHKEMMEIFESLNDYCLLSKLYLYDGHYDQRSKRILKNMLMKNRMITNVCSHVQEQFMDFNGFMNTYAPMINEQLEQDRNLIAKNILFNSRILLMFQDLSIELKCLIFDYICNGLFRDPDFRCLRDTLLDRQFFGAVQSKWLVFNGRNLLKRCYRIH